MINSSDICDLRRDVARNCRLLLRRCEKAGLKVKITSTLRDNEYQATLYAQGRTEPGSIVTNTKVTTFHGKGLAFDICQNIKGREWEVSFFQKVAEIADGLGFEWGGDWTSIVDRPHFQWSGQKHEVTSKKLLAGELPGEMECPMTKAEAVEIIKEKAGLSEQSVNYLDWYRWGDELLIRLAEAMI